MFSIMLVIHIFFLETLHLLYASSKKYLRPLDVYAIF